MALLAALLPRALCLARLVMEAFTTMIAVIAAAWLAKLAVRLIEQQR